MDHIRKLIVDRAADRGTNLAELSRRIGKNHAYLQQFIKRGIPAELSERTRQSLAIALGVDEQQLKSHGTHEQMHPPVERTIASSTTNGIVPSNKHEGPHVRPASELVGDADLPVFGTAQGGKGALIVTDRPVDWVLRPAPLLRVRDGYGMIVTGDSMEPAAKSGSTALVNPHLPPRPGDICIFRSHSDDGAVQVCIKELVRFTDDFWYVKQYNPKKTFNLKRSEWQICHVTVGNYSGR